MTTDHSHNCKCHLRLVLSWPFWPFDHSGPSKRYFLTFRPIVDLNALTKNQIERRTIARSGVCTALPWLALRHCWHSVTDVVSTVTPEWASHSRGAAEWIGLKYIRVCSSQTDQKGKRLSGSVMLLPMQFPNNADYKLWPNKSGLSPNCENAVVKPLLSCQLSLSCHHCVPQYQLQYQQLLSGHLHQPESLQSSLLNSS